MLIALRDPVPALREWSQSEETSQWQSAQKRQRWPPIGTRQAGGEILQAVLLGPPVTAPCHLEIEVGRLRSCCSSQ